MAGAELSFNDILETFELMDDWDDRYRYLIELGRDLPPFQDAWRNAQTKVEGCASQVWLHISSSEDGGVLRFEGDSDAHIVRGLIAILRARLSGLPPAEVAAADPLADFAKLGLDSHLSQQRSNGLRAMVARLQQVASEAA